MTKQIYTRTRRKAKQYELHDGATFVRSKLEQGIGNLLLSEDGDIFYEKLRVPYSIPKKDSTYIVDFALNNGILLEIKGYFRTYDERKKYELIREQNPNLDLRFIFDNPRKLLRTGSSTTYADWADKWNFKYCSKVDFETIKAWVKEKN